MASGTVRLVISARDAFSATLKRAYSAMRGIVTGGARAVAIGAGVAAGTILGLAKAGQVLLRSWQSQAQAEARLTAAIRNTGGAAGFTAAQLRKQAGELQKMSGIGDEAIMSVQTLLTTMGGIKGDEFTRATVAVLDLTEGLAKAGASAEDVQAKAMILGRALADPARGTERLARAGIMLSESQRQAAKTMAEAGDTAGAQRIILAAVEAAYGGMAAGQNEVVKGLRVLRQTIGDVRERIGEAIANSDTFRQALAAVQRIADDLISGSRIDVWAQQAESSFRALVPVVAGAAKAIGAVGNAVRRVGAFAGSIISGSTLADATTAAMDSIESLKQAESDAIADLTRKRTDAARRRESEEAAAMAAARRRLREQERADIMARAPVASTERLASLDTKDLDALRDEYAATMTTMQDQAAAARAEQQQLLDELDHADEAAESARRAIEALTSIPAPVIPPPSAPSMPSIPAPVIPAPTIPALVAPVVPDLPAPAVGRPVVPAPAAPAMPSVPAPVIPAPTIPAPVAPPEVPPVSVPVVAPDAAAVEARIAALVASASNDLGALRAEAERTARVVTAPPAPGVEGTEQSIRLEKELQAAMMLRDRYGVSLGDDGYLDMLRQQTDELMAQVTDQERIDRNARMVAQTRANDAERIAAARAAAAALAAAETAEAERLAELARQQEAHAKAIAAGEAAAAKKAAARAREQSLAKQIKEAEEYGKRLDEAMRKRTIEIEVAGITRQLDEIEGRIRDVMRADVTDPRQQVAEFAERGRQLEDIRKQEREDTDRQARLEEQAARAARGLAPQLSRRGAAWLAERQEWQGANAQAAGLQAQAAELEARRDMIQDQQLAELQRIAGLLEENLETGDI